MARRSAVGPSSRAARDKGARSSSNTTSASNNRGTIEAPGAGRPVDAVRRTRRCSRQIKRVRTCSRRTGEGDRAGRGPCALASIPETRIVGSACGLDLPRTRGGPRDRVPAACGEGPARPCDARASCRTRHREGGGAAASRERRIAPRRSVPGSTPSRGMEAAGRQSRRSSRPSAAIRDEAQALGVTPIRTARRNRPVRASGHPSNARRLLERQPQRRAGRPGRPSRRIVHDARATACVIEHLLLVVAQPKACSPPASTSGTTGARSFRSAAARTAPPSGSASRSARARRSCRTADRCWVESGLEYAPEAVHRIPWRAAVDGDLGRGRRRPMRASARGSTARSRSPRRRAPRRRPLPGCWIQPRRRRQPLGEAPRAPPADAAPGVVREFHDDMLKLATVAFFAPCSRKDATRANTVSTEAIRPSPVTARAGPSARRRSAARGSCGGVVAVRRIRRAWPAPGHGRAGEHPSVPTAHLDRVLRRRGSSRSPLGRLGQLSLPLSTSAHQVAHGMQAGCDESSGAEADAYPSDTSTPP